MIDVMFYDAGREPTQKPDPKHYQGTPCKRGHGGIRFRVNRNCVECEPRPEDHMLSVSTKYADSLFKPGGLDA